MANEWLFDKTELTTPASDDLVAIIDVSDPGLTTLGTEKKIQYGNLIPTDQGNAVANANDASLSNQTNIVITAPSVAVEVTGRVIVASSLNNLFNVTNPGAPTKPTFTYIGIKTGLFLLYGNARLSFNTSAEIKTALGFFLNGSPLPESYNNSSASSIYGSVSYSLVELSENDEITFGVQNFTNDTDIGVRTLLAMITQIA